MKTNKYLKFAGYVISLFFLYFTFKDTNFPVILDNLKNVNLPYLLFALGLNFLFFALRGLYQINNLHFLKPGIPFLISFHSIGIAQMYNVMFPARLGEFLRAFFLSQKQGLKTTSVLSYIFIEKIMDLLVILSLLLLFAKFKFEDMEIANTIAFFGGGIFLIVLLMVFYFRFNQKFLSICEKLIPRNLYDLVHKTNLDVLEGLKFFRTVKQVLKSITLLVLSWGIILCIFWLVSYPYVILLGLPLYSCIFFMVFSALSLSVPSAPAGIGVMHYGLFLAVKVLGGNVVVSKINLVAAFVISMHFFLMSLDVATGGGIMLLSRFFPQEKCSDEE